LIKPNIKVKNAAAKTSRTKTKGIPPISKNMMPKKNQRLA